MGHQVTKVYLCDSCTLPDCDSSSRKCRLRMAEATHRDTKPCDRTDVIRRNYNAAYAELYGRKHNERRRLPKC